MECLAVLVQHEVGDIHDVVDRTQTDSCQRFLEPIGTLPDLHATHHHAAVTRTSLGVLHRDAYRAVGLIDAEAALVGTGEDDIILPVRPVVGIEVACHAVVRDSVRTVRRDIHLDERVVLQMEVLACRQTYRRILRQHYDTCMIRTDTYLVLGTNHT